MAPNFLSRRNTARLRWFVGCIVMMMMMMMMMVMMYMYSQLAKGAKRMTSGVC